MRALVLTSGGSIAAQVLRAWLGAGNSIAALWIGPKSLRRFLQRDLVLGSQWSVGALAKRFNLPVRRNPEFRNWSDAVDNIRRLRPEVLITLATGQIVPEYLISTFSSRTLLLLTIQRAFQEQVEKCDLMLGGAVWKDKLSSGAIRASTRTISLGG